MWVSILSFLLFSVLFNLFLYLLAFKWQTDKLTDLSYALSFAVISLCSYYYSSRSEFDFIVLLMVLLWSIRLGSYLFIRIHQMGRDTRFDDIRSNKKSFFLFWLMQGLTCAIVSFPMIALNAVEDVKPNSLSYFFLVIGFIGLLIESIADYQKFIFKKNNPTQMMTSGLWKKIRHPNYLGELLFWWGIFLGVAVTIGNYWTILAPLWITMIITKFSGIPILDKKWNKDYGANGNYESYKSNSYALIPYLY